MAIIRNQIFDYLTILLTKPDTDLLEYASLRFVLYPLPIQRVPTHAIPATPPLPELLHHEKVSGTTPEDCIEANEAAFASMMLSSAYQVAPCSYKEPSITYNEEQKREIICIIFASFFD